MELEFVKCQGSGNDFVMIDAVSQRVERLDISRLAVEACDRERGIGADGLLLAVRVGGGFGMRMFNPDGSEAEMCGNGIRCVARMIRKYTNADRFTLSSGGRRYAVARETDIDGGVRTYGVRIPIAMYSPDFAMFGPGERFVARAIPQLDGELAFTALSLGNPHIVAQCDRIDLQRLEYLGRRVCELPELFPRGVNVSLYEVAGRDSIAVATFERGAGLTLSCGTAMTASTTAAVLTGAMPEERTIKVRNRGGMVLCRCETGDSPATELIGNASFEYAGVIKCGDGELSFEKTKIYDAETASYREFAEKSRVEL